MHTPNLVLAAAVAFALQSSGASAFFSERITTPPPAPAPLAPLREPKHTLEQIGFGVGAPSKSYGKDLPLDIAIGMITPPGWGQQVPAEIKARKVTWNARNGQPWPFVLRDLAQQNGFGVLVDWNTQRIAVSATGDYPPPPVKAAQALPSMPAATTLPRPADANVAARPGAPGMLPAQSARATPPTTTSLPPRLTVPVIPPQPRFSVRVTDATLRGALERWCRESRWTLVWEARVDYPIVADAAFDSAADISEAVRQMQDSIDRSGAKLPVTLRTADNRVLRVTSATPGME